MASPREQILSRYREAASIIAESPHDDGLQSETLDDCSAAMEELLRRQARLIHRIHDTNAEDSANGHDVDERLLQARLDDVASVAMSRFYSYRFDRVPHHWRRIYTDTLILTTHHRVLTSLFDGAQLREEALDLIVEYLDRALITAGGAGKLLGSVWIEKTLEVLEGFWLAQQAEERPQKRQRLDIADDVFPATEPHGRPELLPDRECPRHEGWTIERFEDYMNEGEGAPLPMVFTDLISSWPALTDRPWKSPGYLLSRTFGGRRLVPVEVGRSYVDEGWGQELIQFKAFLARYVAPDASAPQQVGYLAQHDLFRQIPPLRNDIRVPDLCWASVPPHPADPARDRPPLDVPLLNAWFGPARTITPLHTDGYHNLLCQVVGAKYVRLYAPGAGRRLRPRAEEGGVDMSNTAEVDVGVLEGWDQPPEGEGDADAVRRMREGMEGVEYWECILNPGDTLLIPIGWWHYVRSLSVSFSVSFWWN